MEVYLLDPRPRFHQQENWLIDPSRQWTQIGRMGWDELRTLAEPPERLWPDGDRTNDRIPWEQVAVLRTSLRLIHVDRATLTVTQSRSSFGKSKRRLLGRFSHAGAEYGLWVTDEIYENWYLKFSDGDYELGESLLTISLGEEYKGYCYKLLAGIMERTGGPRQ